MACAERTHRWAIVLAGGSGTRLAHLAKDERGRPVPKQYCSLGGSRSLLGAALQRAQRAVPREHVVAVVAAEHERFWRPELRDRPAENTIVQPDNRGTAPGVLLPLLSILARDPEACVAIYPSDHFVARESLLTDSVTAAFADARRAPAGIVLLGIEPDAPETDYGWVLPEPGPRAVRRVASFVEKPDPHTALELARRGAVWNGFLLAARGEALLELCRRRLPGLVAEFQRGAPHASASAARALYRQLPAADFSRDVLQGAEPWLQLRVVPRCGWTDLGTPARVAACLRQQPGAGRDRARAEAPADLRALLAARGRSPARVAVDPVPAAVGPFPERRL